MPKLTELPMLRVGLIGSGFIAAFHLQSMVGVRNVSIGGVYSRSAERRTRIAEKARSLGLGEARAFDSIEAGDEGIIGNGPFVQRLRPVGWQIA